jgi:NADH-quinone oxidoreductase subunit E
VTVKIPRRPEDAPPPRVLNDEQRAKAEAIRDKYPNSRSATLPLLFLVQAVEGHVTDDGIREVAEILELTSAQVLATASFYSMLKEGPQGTYLVSVCRNIACTHRGGRAIVRQLADHLGIEPGQTTDDGMFTLETAECLATCDGAPTMQVNYEDFYDLTPDKAIDVVERLRRGEDVRAHRGSPVKKSGEISQETACAGLGWKLAHDDEAARTIGGEVPRPDIAPGFRPKVPGKGEED